jgi:hypothetical protein
MAALLRDVPLEPRLPQLWPLPRASINYTSGTTVCTALGTVQTEEQALHFGITRAFDSPSANKSLRQLSHPRMPALESLAMQGVDLTYTSISIISPTNVLR